MECSKEVKKILNEMNRQLKIHEACILRQSLQLAQKDINLELKDVHINNLIREIAFLNSKPTLDSVQ